MQRFLLILAFAVLAFGASGCASMKFNHVPQAKKSDWPALNETTTVYVGDEMLIQGFSMKQKALQLMAPVDGACYDIPMGFYAMTGDDDKRYYFAAVGSGGGVIRAGLCDPFVGITVPKSSAGEVCVMTTFGANACYSAQYRIVEVESEHSTSKQQSLIYSGVEGKNIKFTYIERQSGRTNFSNSVTYDLAKSPIINYRGARISIAGADNERITYTVLENFTNR